MGPTLFLIYINDLCTLNIPNCKIITYADDTVLLIKGRTWELVQRSAEYALSAVISWLDKNLLTLNYSKTKYITFSTSTRTQPDATFKIKAHSCASLDQCSCAVLERVTEIKYLGVTLDNHLRWDKHIKSLAGRVRKLGKVFKTIRHLGDTPFQLKMYKALGESVIRYCILAWGGAAKSRLICLERAQRMLLKIITFKPFLFSTYDLYQEFKVLTVRQVFLHNLILKQHCCPKDISDSSLASRRNKTKVYHIPRTNLKKNRYHINTLGPSLYNYVNKELKISNLSYHKLRLTLQDWLKKLNYEETENLLTHIV